MDNPLPIEFHSEARAEADASFAYYLERSRSVAECFYLEMEAALKQIQDHSERWPAYLYGTRRYLLKRFPFVIVYRAGKSRIEIVAVAHEPSPPRLLGREGSLKSRSESLLDRGEPIIPARRDLPCVRNLLFV